MEETINFIIELAKKQHLNVNGTLDLRPLLKNLNPVIKNNLKGAFEILFKQGVFKNANDIPQLTEAGFQKIYGNIEQQMEETINFIIELAKKQHLNVNGVLDLRLLVQNLNPVIKNNQKDAFEILFKQGVFKNANDIPQLTEAGFQKIYGNIEQQMEETINFIIELAKKQHLNVNGVLDLRLLVQNLNPVIKNNQKDAFEILFKQGVFENVNETPRLTEAGFQKIYK